VTSRPSRFAGAALAAALACSPVAARADYAAGSFLIDASFGVGVEPHDRQQVQCSKLMGSGSTAEQVSVPQCNMVLTFGVTGEALWRGLVGFGLGLYAAEGTPVQVSGNDAQGRALPSFGDRISTVVSAAARPLAPLVLYFGDRWLTRLAAGLGVQLGASVEHARTALDSSTKIGLHVAASLDVPLYGANSRGGVALRLAMRLLVSPEAQFLPQPMGNFQVDVPGTAVQLYAGFAYYL
jgi:hypothetical protein